MHDTKNMTNPVLIQSFSKHLPVTCTILSIGRVQRCTRQPPARQKLAVLEEGFEIHKITATQGRRVQVPAVLWSLGSVITGPRSSGLILIFHFLGHSSHKALKCSNSQNPNYKSQTTFSTEKQGKNPIKP